MRCIIAGTRNLVRPDPNEKWKYDLADVRFIKNTLTRIVEEEIDWWFESVTHIVSGCARGPDVVGQWWAKDKGLEVIKMPADWDTHGKSAGFLRNSEMVESAEAAIALWDGSSKGTEDLINKALSNELMIHVEYF